MSRAPMSGVCLAAFMLVVFLLTLACGSQVLASQTEKAVFKPAPGETLTIEAEWGASYEPQFLPETAEPIIDGENLIFLFADGSRIVFENIVEMADSAESPKITVDRNDVLAGLIGQLSSTTSVQVDRPAAGETVSFDPRPGETYVIIFDAAAALSTVEGDNLVLSFEDGGRIVFTGGADPDLAQDGAPRFNVGGVLVPMTMIASAARGDVGQAGPQTSLDLAASGAVGGGGELFGLVPIISWLLDRLDLISEAQAAVAEQATAPAESPLLEQLWAQFRIVREAEVLKAAMAYETVMADIIESLQNRLAGGGGSRADLDQARAVHLEAQLEVKEAEYRHTLAIDAHQDDFGERLLKAAYPTWRDSPPRGLDAIRAAVTPDLHKAARRYGRQRDFAEDTMQLIETLSLVALDVRNAYVEQFEVVQRTLLDVLGAERVLFQTQVRLAQRDFELRSAEAWLLAATGKLSADYIRRPGWQ